MRLVIRSNEFYEFYNSLSEKVQNKLDYALNILREMKIVNTKIAKKIVDSDFYELRISVGNEYRVILFTIDHDNIIESTQILLLNGFQKKSTKDYKKQLEIAQRIIKTIE